MLSDEELLLNFCFEFFEVWKFYFLEINIVCEGSVLWMIIIEKMIERIFRYLWFLKYVKNIVFV